MPSHREAILTATKPPRNNVNFDAIAPTLRSINRIIIWAWEAPQSRWTKVPKAWDGKSNHDAHDPAIWRGISNARSVYSITKGMLAPGFVFNGDGIVGIDLDDCRNPETAEVAEWALAISIAINSYTEISPSGTGLKIFLRGKPPAKFTHKHKRLDGGEIEIFHNKKFFTLTGQRLEQLPADLCDRPDELNALMQSLGLCNITKANPVTSRSVFVADNSDDDVGTAVEAIKVISDFDDYDTWLRVGQGLRSVSDSLFQVWVDWSSQSAKFSFIACEKKWNSFNGSGVTVRTLCKMADDSGRDWRLPRQRASFPSDVTFEPMDQDPLAHIGIDTPPDSYALTTARGTATSPIETEDDPHRLAKGFVRWWGTTHDRLQKLCYWRGEYWRWNGTVYAVVDHDEISGLLTQFIKMEFDRIAALKHEAWIAGSGKGDPPSPMKVKRSIVLDTQNALRSITGLPGGTVQPSWLCDPWNNPLELVPTLSGLLHLPSIADDSDYPLLPPTPEFFNGTAVNCRYDRLAECVRWLEFLHSVFGDDRESITLLQQWMGYLLAADTSHHKMLLIVGPKRSGKGTIGRLIKALFGVCLANPTLSSLAGNFGLWPLLNKTIAVISDARLSGQVDTVTILERLLSISGGDPQNVDRKCLPTVTAVAMPVRFMIFTNELPRLPDASGAITSRFLTLKMTRSFLGQEDKTLDASLAAELPGILNWCIDGWKHLRDAGRFLQPASSKEMIDEFNDLASPIGAFVRDCCIVGPEWSVDTKDLYAAWRRWCELHGRDKPGTEQSFGRDLRAAVPGLVVRQPRIQGNRIRRYDGVSINPSGTHSDLNDEPEFEPFESLTEQSFT